MSRHIRTCFARFACLAALLAALPVAAHAADAFSYNTTPSIFDAATGFTLGFRFSTTMPLTFAGIGVFDRDADGLGADQEVGLWETSTRTLLASGTVTNANSFLSPTAQIGGRYRYISLPAQTLPAGNYILAATRPANADRFPRFVPSPPGNFSFMTPPMGATINGWRRVTSSTLTFPVQAGNNDMYMSANLLVVPESGTLALVGVGCTVLGVAIVRRRARTVAV